MLLVSTIAAATGAAQESAPILLHDRASRFWASVDGGRSSA
jgi:hypothetical protein